SRQVCGYFDTRWHFDTRSQQKPRARVSRPALHIETFYGHGFSMQPCSGRLMEDDRFRITSVEYMSNLSTIICDSP
ncbi:hypothetical protein DPMN_027123, partial [Dreissena polymorpha]